MQRLEVSGENDEATYLSAHRHFAGLLTLNMIEDIDRVRETLVALTLSQCASEVLDRLMGGLDAPLEKEGTHCTGSNSHLALEGTPHHCCCWTSLTILSVRRCGILELGVGPLSRLPALEVAGAASVG